MKKKPPRLRFVQIVVDSYANLYGLTTDGRVFQRCPGKDYWEEFSGNARSPTDTWAPRRTVVDPFAPQQTPMTTTLTEIRKKRK